MGVRSASTVMRQRRPGTWRQTSDVSKGYKVGGTNRNGFEGSSSPFDYETGIADNCPHHRLHTWDASSDPLPLPPTKWQGARDRVTHALESLIGGTAVIAAAHRLTHLPHPSAASMCHYSHGMGPCAHRGPLYLWSLTGMHAHGGSRRVPSGLFTCQLSSAELSSQSLPLEVHQQSNHVPPPAGLRGCRLAEKESPIPPWAEWSAAHLCTSYRAGRRLV
mmetsp:Transcript_35373/g.80265  ORF Transcript_35373/g.80265 Transcript_35373/m.80265 type:complete len:219 (+) Transcript_35373:61-717(+)